jgi:hypothetical protein
VTGVHQPIAERGRSVTGYNNVPISVGEVQAKAVVIKEAPDRGTEPGLPASGTSVPKIQRWSLPLFPKKRSLP